MRAQPKDRLIEACERCVKDLRAADVLQFFTKCRDLHEPDALAKVLLD